MYTPDALEDINVDQLVTATDRLLLRGSPSTLGSLRELGGHSAADIAREAQAAFAASKARRASQGIQGSVREGVRARGVPRRLLSTIAVIVGAWLGVVTACLLT